MTVNTTKRMLSIRIPNDMHRQIAARARRADVDPSHMARRLLTYALTHMPDGWVPDPEGQPR